MYRGGDPSDTTEEMHSPGAGHHTGARCLIRVERSGSRRQRHQMLPFLNHLNAPGLIASGSASGQAGRQATGGLPGLWVQSRCPGLDQNRAWEWKRRLADQRQAVTNRFSHAGISPVGNNEAGTGRTGIYRRCVSGSIKTVRWRCRHSSSTPDPLGRPGSVGGGADRAGRLRDRCSLVGCSLYRCSRRLQR